MKKKFCLALVFASALTAAACGIGNRSSENSDGINENGVLESLSELFDEDTDQIQESAGAAESDILLPAKAVSKPILTADICSPDTKMRNRSIFMIVLTPLMLRQWHICFITVRKRSRSMYQDLIRQALRICSICSVPAKTF